MSSFDHKLALYWGTPIFITALFSASIGDWECFAPAWSWGASCPKFRLAKFSLSSCGAASKWRQARFQAMS